MDDRGPSEQFSLRWNNFHTNLTTEFLSLLQGEDLVDVTIAADGKFVKAHKIVLSVCSPYFKELFKINPCKHPIVILPEVGYGALCGLLQFMYSGEVSVCQEELGDFLKTAELLQVKGLTDNDSQDQTKNMSKRPVTPETKRKSKMPRRIVLDENIEQRNKDKVNVVAAKVRRQLPSIQSIASGNGNISSRTIVVPKKEPIDYSESEEIEPIAECSVVSTGESSAASPRFHIGQPLKNRLSQDQLQDGAQVGFRITSRGRLQLVHYGFIYHCNRQKDDKIFWKCGDYNKTGCRARCITVGESITVTYPFHNHKVREELSNLEHESSDYDGHKPFWDSEMIKLTEMK